MASRPMHTVEFLPAGMQVQVEEGTTLLEAAQKTGLHINASCGGSGVCGKCRVLVEYGEIQGGVSEKLSPEELQSGIRQACTAMVRGDVRVRVVVTSGLGQGGLTTTVPRRHRATARFFDIEELREAGIFKPPVEKFFLELPRPSPVDNMADAGRVVTGMNHQYNERHLMVTLPVLRKLRRVLREDDFRVTVTLARPVSPGGRTFIVDVQPGNWVKRNFALAVDIGTTTVYGQLVDLHQGRVLAETGDYNGQISYGEDVISRIICSEKDDGLETMRRAVTKTINGIIDRILSRAAVKAEEITSITLAGNTVMTHLFLGLEPNNIRRSPYIPVSTFFPPIRSTDLELHLPTHSVALVYPAISSWVGGDIVAGVMGSGMYRTEKLTLYIDIGTNAEIVIGSREWLVCTACSAGPAFEGGGISCGMRAAAGAITDCSIHPETWEPMNTTLERRPPIGICGSGLLNIIAVFFERGIIDQRGKYRRDSDCERIRKGRSGYEFVLAWQEESGAEHDIVLTEVDIENFMRAKGAIFAGVKTLLQEVGLGVADLEQVILAGAFGSFIDIDSAMTVGLLPEIDMDKVVYVGNGSLMGCRMSALSNHIRRDVVEVVRKMTSFELSEVPGFKDEYVAALFLPHTDLSLFPSSGFARKRTGKSMENGGESYGREDG
ncbi:ASKHA domain-containing protein [Desulfolithobacter sp.]